MYHYDWTHNPYLKRRNEKHEGILDLSTYDENNQPPLKQESSFHGDYVIDEDGDKILLNGQANLIDDIDDENLPLVIPEDTVKKGNDLVFQTANEDRIKGIDHHLSSHFPEDPEPWFEEQLDDNGATITQSITHFPASNTTLTKRSMTSEERRSGYYL